MKRVFLGLALALGIFGMSSPSHGGTKVRILPYKIWKQKKIDEAKTVVAELKHASKKADEDEKSEATQRLSQAELNLGVVKELSANDYFLLYVSPQFKNNNDAFVQAAKALSPRDMADILSAYQKRLQTVDVSANAEATETGDEANIQEKSVKSP